MVDDHIAERFVGPLRLCCIGGICEKHRNESSAPWIPGPEELAAFRDDLAIAFASEA